MVRLGEILKKVERLAVDNSPVILTAIGVTGALTTAYFTGKASFKAAEILLSDESDISRMDKKEKAILVWRLYIPAAVSAGFTVTAIICANRISSKRAVALATAYSISERAFEEYRAKVVEKLGKKEQAIRDEVAQDRVNRNPVSNNQVIIASEKSVLCYEAFTGRYFLSDMEDLKKAQNDTNSQVINDSYASLSDFYDRVGLPHTAQSDEVGWNLDKLMKLDLSATLSEGGRPCICVDFSVSPVRHYNRLS